MNFDHPSSPYSFLIPYLVLPHLRDPFFFYFVQCGKRPTELAGVRRRNRHIPSLQHTASTPWSPSSQLRRAASEETVVERGGHREAIFANSKSPPPPPATFRRTPGESTYMFSLLRIGSIQLVYLSLAASAASHAHVPSRRGFDSPSAQRAFPFILLD